MKTIFATIGLFVTVMCIMGLFDIGHFRLYYGDDPHGCARMEERIKDQP